MDLDQLHAGDRIMVHTGEKISVDGGGGVGRGGGRSGLDYRRIHALAQGRGRPGVCRNRRQERPAGDSGGEGGRPDCRGPHRPHGRGGHAPQGERPDHRRPLLGPVHSGQFPPGFDRVSGDAQEQPCPEHAHHRLLLRRPALHGHGPLGGHLHGGAEWNPHQGQQLPGTAGRGRHVDLRQDRHDDRGTPGSDQHHSHEGGRFPPRRCCNTPAPPRRPARTPWRRPSWTRCAATAGRFRPIRTPRCIRPAASRPRSPTGSSAWEAGASCRRTPSTSPPATEAVNRLVRAGENIVYVAEDDELLGVLGIQDALRENMKKAINRLRYTGIDDIVLLTGDVEQHAEIIADRMTVDRYQGGGHARRQGGNGLEAPIQGHARGDGRRRDQRCAGLGLRRRGNRHGRNADGYCHGGGGHYRHRRRSLDDPGGHSPGESHDADHPAEFRRGGRREHAGNRAGLDRRSAGVLGAVLHNSCTVAVVLNSSRLLFHDVERRAR